MCKSAVIIPDVNCPAQVFGMQKNNGTWDTLVKISPYLLHPRKYLYNGANTKRLSKIENAVFLAA